MNLETSSFVQVPPTTAPKDAPEDATRDALTLARVAPARALADAGDAEIHVMPIVLMIVRVVVKEPAVGDAPITARVVAKILVKANVTPRAPMTVRVVAPAVAG